MRSEDLDVTAAKAPTGGSSAGADERRHTDATPERVDLVPLLRAYRGALRLSREPPASINVPSKLPRAVRRLYPRLRPAWGCHYFATRYVRRVIEALERAFAARIAVGHADPDDEVEADSLQRFKSSLAPSPSRLLTIVGLLAAILLSQALLETLVRFLVYDVGDKPSPTSIERAFSEIDLSVDVQSFSDLLTALVSANLLEDFAVLLTVFATVYVFCRPLVSGYRLSYLCVGGPDGPSSLQNQSDLHRQARELRIGQREQEISEKLDLTLPRQPPVDIVIKSLPWLLVPYIAIGVHRLVGDAASAIITIALPALLVVGAFRLGGFGWRGRRDSAPRIRQRALLCGLGSIILVVVATQLALGATIDPPVLPGVLLGIALLRLGWLAKSLHDRRYPVTWVLAPLVFIIVLAAVVPVGDDDSAIAEADRRFVLESNGLAGLPPMGRDRARALLISTRDLTGTDLRGQQLQGLTFSYKRLVGARLQFADLRSADFERADLHDAKLRGAVLSATNFKRADLTAADLRCADLRKADLHEADLTRARLRGAGYDKRTQWPAGFDPKPRGAQDVADAALLDDSSVYEWWWASSC